MVPALSLLQQHYHRLKELNPKEVTKDLQRHHRLISQLMSKNKRALDSSKSVDNLAVSIHDTIDLKPEIKEIKRRSRKARWPIYYYSLMAMFGITFGWLMIGVTFSWNNLTFDVYYSMKTFLMVGTILFECAFLLWTFLVQPLTSLLTYIDISFVVVSFFFNWLWFEMTLWAKFRPEDLLTYSTLFIYMTLRIWYTCMQAVYSPIPTGNSQRSGFIVLDKLHFVWITRSASSVAHIYPDLLATWDNLSQTWGDQLKDMCKISIFVTDSNQDACDLLTKSVQGTSLYQSGTITFKRPSIQDLIEHHSNERIKNENQVSTSQSLIAFCGSPMLAKEVKEAKVLNDLSLFITGNTHHQMDLVINSYGSHKKLKEDTPE